MFALLRDRAEQAARRLGIRLVWAPLSDAPVAFGDDVVVASEDDPEAAVAALEGICPKSDVRT